MRFVEHRSWAAWTGFGSFSAPDGTYYPAKTLWDVLDLLIVPLVLALGAYWFNKSEKANERKIADDRQKEQALQNYLDKITELLVERSLIKEKGNIDVPVVQAAKIRTITTLRTLDLDRKNILLQFLRDSKLADFILSPASLSKADLRMANLMGTNLSEANLSEAVLYKANLSGANLSGADLCGVNLMGADLRRADLSGADLSEANLRGANLTRATIAPEQLATVKSLSGTIMPDGSKHE